MPLCILLLLGIRQICGPLEARDEFLATDLATFILVHNGEELLDALQVLLHQALLKLAYHVFELLEADLAALVHVTGTEEFSRLHVPARQQVDKLLNCKRFKLDIALASGARSDEMRLTLQIVRLQRILVLRVSDVLVAAVLVEDVLQSVRLRRRQAQLVFLERLSEDLDGDLAGVGHVTDAEERFRCHVLGLETRYKFCHDCKLWVVSLGGCTPCNLLLALLGKSLDLEASVVALEVALDLDDFGDGAFDALPFFFSFGLLDAGL